MSLMYLLNILYSNQNPSFFPLEGAVPISVLYFHPPYCNAWWGSHLKINLTFLFLFSVTPIKYTIFFVVSSLSTKCQMNIQGLLIVLGKPRRKTCFSTMKYDCRSIVWQWNNRKRFLSARDKIWIFKVAFYNKTIFSLRHGYFNRDLSTVTLVKYYISMRHLNRKTQ